MTRRGTIQVWALALAACAVIPCAAVLWLAERLATRSAVDTEVASAQTSARLLAASFRRELDKFRMATSVLAQDPDAVVAITTRDRAQLQRLSEKFTALSNEMHATTLYVLGADGITLAASNWHLPTSFVGMDYRFRAYYREALQTGRHEQFALGSVSRRPGLYIARRIEAAGQPVGVIVVKVEFDALEDEWRRSGRAAFATNRSDVILVTSVPDWRFETTQALTSAKRAALIATRDFGDSALAQNRLFAAGQVAGAGTSNSYRLPYTEAVEDLPGGWRVHVLAATEPLVRAARREARLAVIATWLLLLALGGIAYFRRRSTAAKAALRASEQLRALNERLVQANKLATLGQIAAGVGHEINQPLAAIVAYAGNSTKLMAAGNLGAVDENLSRIASLAERIGNITGELRGFARRASGVTEPVSIDAAVGGALLLLHDRISTTNAAIHYPQRGTDVHVLAERVRLEQILVNLLQNALDAAGTGASIEIRLHDADGLVELAVRDNGPGLSAEVRATLFQPFSTAKKDGLGLGLVIARDIAIDFGGELVAGTPDRGAEFILRLRPAS